MREVRGCDLPEGYYYQSEHNTWLRFEGDEATLGMTAYACALAGEIVTLIAAQKDGQAIKKDRSCATVESANWVGAILVPFAAELLAINEAAEETPALINQDPYGKGWIARLKITDASFSPTQLLQGDAAAAAIEEQMNEEGFKGCAAQGTEE